MYRIGEFSALTKTTIKTLRYYDETELLKPSFVDGQTGYRYYETRQMYPLQRIVSLRQAGLSVDEVRRILDGADARTVLSKRRASLEQTLAETQRMLVRLDCIMHHIEEGETMAYQAIVKKLPACTVYSKEGVLKSFSEMSAFIIGAEEEFRTANPGLECVKPDYCFVNYLDGEYRETDIHVRYSNTVTHAGVETDTIRFHDLPEVDAVCVCHPGSYSGLGQAYTFVLNWTAQNGYVIAECPRERYIDGGWNKEDEADYLTEIQIPVRKV
jgi:DNA-binding transcriptional MerR regulator